LSGTNAFMSNVNIHNETNIYNNSNLDNYVLVIGGANIERIYALDEKPKIWQKQFYTKNKIKVYGGSGLNYSLRLAKTGIKVLPILPVGNDDAGREIANLLVNTGCCLLNNMQLLSNDIETNESLILTEGKGRTIFAQPNTNNFRNIYENKNHLVTGIRNNPKIVMIGHIHSDNLAQYGSNDFDSLITTKVINTYCNKSLIYLNLGQSQLEHGFNAWKDILKKVHILQLNLDEIKQFFQVNKELLSLHEIKNMIDTNLPDTHVIITLDRMGALVIPSKNKRDHNIYAPELPLGTDYIDKTGAGDAFASGMVYHLMKNSMRVSEGNFTSISTQDLEGGAKYARSWATYACTTLGGVNGCPAFNDIKQFHKEHSKRDSAPKIQEATDPIIDLIEKAYLKCQS